MKKLLAVLMVLILLLPVLAACSSAESVESSSFVYPYVSHSKSSSSSTSYTWDLPSDEKESSSSDKAKWTPVDLPSYASREKDLAEMEKNGWNDSMSIYDDGTPKDVELVCEDFAWLLENWDKKFADMEEDDFDYYERTGGCYDSCLVYFFYENLPELAGITVLGHEAIDNSQSDADMLCSFAAAVTFTAEKAVGDIHAGKQELVLEFVFDPYDDIYRPFRLWEREKYDYAAKLYTEHPAELFLAERTDVWTFDSIDELSDKDVFYLTLQEAFDMGEYACFDDIHREALRRFGRDVEKFVWYNNFNRYYLYHPESDTYSWGGEDGFYPRLYPCYLEEKDGLTTLYACNVDNDVYAYTMRFDGEIWLIVSSRKAGEKEAEKYLSPYLN